MGWEFLQPFFDRAVDRWELAQRPAEDRILAFYDWCLWVAESGPPRGSVAHPDIPGLFSSYVTAADVTVDYLVTEKGIAVREIF